MPQGSALRLIIFTFYFNEWDTKLRCSLTVLAHDIEVGGKAFVVGDGEIIREDLDRSIQLSEKRQMSFNLHKSGGVHFSIQK